MDILRDYVEVMFQDFPKTKANFNLKDNILESMENKYEDLIADGKTGQEAVGIVIAQFGNIDELKEAYDILPSDEDVEYLPTDKLLKYVSFKQKFAHLIAVGVFMIILSALGVVLLKEALGVPILLTVGIIAVAIFVFAGLRGNKYEDIESGRYYLFGNDKAEIQKRYDVFKPKYQVIITLGVVLCILSVTLYYILGQVLNVSDMFSYSTLFSLVAIAVYLFIRYCVQNSMYNILLRDEKTIRELQGEKKYEWVYGITMPLAAMVFLAFGFLKDAWHPGWIIFPITAILSNGIVEILKRSYKKS